MTEDTKATRLLVRGRVQGVGFRPTVHRLATSAGLGGDVLNTSAGVRIEIEGAAADVDAFCERLPDAVPALADITGLERADIEPRGRTGFVILPSRADAEGSVASGGGARIPFDVATCEACLGEVRDPADRRHGYAFTNCTLCGPRYTIIESVPYDRPATSMKAFDMCPACRAEYDDPSDRRYHAQPNACADCGPHLSLVTADGAVPPGEPIGAARRLLAEGHILAVRGVGGFHLAVDARSERAVERLRGRKARGAKPFAVMAPDLDAAARIGRVRPPDAELLGSPRGPIVLLDRASPFPLADAIAPGNPRVGVMLPYTPAHHLLLEGFEALVMTSGNLSEEPIARQNHEARERLAGLADAFLSHDRDILMSCDDSVVYHRGDAPAFVRRSRGFAPDPVPFPRAPGPILAVGAHMKTTVCLAREDEAFLSQHIGDLENLITYEHFQRCVEHLEGLVGAKPDVVACDLHPDYLSTRFARELADVRVEPVQHHHAHLAAVMADRGLSGEVIGLALDGTGLGEDGTIWGGEMLVGGYSRVRRAARLKPFPLPGGEAAIREPWRTAAGLLLAHGGKDLATERVGQLPGVDARKVEQLVTAAARGVQAPLTSSLGRLFDAVSALLSICMRAEYDAQAAVELEAAAGELQAHPWDLPLVDAGNLMELDTGPLVEGLLGDLARGVPAASLAAAFHESLVAGLADACQEVHRQGGPGRVVLSGGCLMNRRLDAGLERALTEHGFEVFAHRLVPANDGGLCLGQAAVAASRMRAEQEP